MSIVIHDVNLIDGHSADPLPGRDIVINGTKISQVRRTGPGGREDATHIDGAGRWVMPGLVNCHTHLYSRSLRTVIPGTSFADARRGLDAQQDSTLLFLMARNGAAELFQGITTTRDLGARAHLNIRVRDAFATGLLPGPRVVACGMPIAMTGGHVWAFSREADGPHECRKAVREQLKAGADVIKVMASGGIARYPQEDFTAPELGEDEMAVITEEAHRRGRTVTAHAYPTTAIDAAVHAGVDCIEHGVYLDEQTVAAMKQQGTNYVPTLSNMLMGANEQRCRLAGTPERAGIMRRMVVEPQQESFRMAISQGIPVGMGTDSNGDPVEELSAMVDLGYSPMQALIAGTSVGASICGLDDRIGTIVSGKTADLLLLPRSPLEDLANLNDIDMIVQSGAMARCGRHLLAGAALAAWPAPKNTAYGDDLTHHLSCAALQVPPRPAAAEER